MAASEFSLCITHGQIAVFDPSLSEPFNEWTDRHHAQGFTWRPGSVSFATLEEGGVYDVILDIAAYFEELPATAARVIDVPFEVPRPGRIEIASIAESVLVDIAPGVYQLRFEHGHPGESAKRLIKLTLVPSISPIFALVRIDHEIGDRALLLTASPA